MPSRRTAHISPRVVRATTCVAATFIAAAAVATASAACGPRRESLERSAGEATTPAPAAVSRAASAAGSPAAGAAASGAVPPTSSPTADTVAPVDASRLDLGIPVPEPGPRTIAVGRVEVLRGEQVTLRYRIESKAADRVRVTLVVTRRDGTAVARLEAGDGQPCGRTLSIAVPTRLPAGSYRYTVYAIDEDGRYQRRADSSSLVVRDVIPRPADVERAIAWLRRRSGYVGFAVIDSEGDLHGWHQDQQFVSASVVKAMLLVAYLRGHPGGPGFMSSTLGSMIGVSDNGAASAVHGIVGDAGMYAVARAAGMRRFAGCGYWSGAQITAADQARFFARIFDLVPAGDRTYARHLLSHIASYQSWGIPAAARHHGWTVYFKGGWRGTDRGQLVHQVARLEKDGRVVTIAVMTDGDPSMGYGIETIRGAAERVLGLH